MNRVIEHRLRAKGVAICLVVLALQTGCSAVGPNSVESAPHHSRNEYEVKERGVVRGGTQILVSISEQKLALVSGREVVRQFKISTSRFGASNAVDSYGTPVGRFHVGEKIGAGVEVGRVFVDRMPTEKISLVNAPGEATIITRILRLSGSERRTLNTWDRYIYIHGSPAESTLGEAVSGGCIRMSSDDVIWVFERVSEGTEVFIRLETISEIASWLVSVNDTVSRLKSAALVGDVVAIRGLCLGYHVGTDLFSIDRPEAILWCSRGEAVRDAASTVALGEIFEHGFGVAANSKYARELYRRSAHQGNGQGAFNMYRVLSEGIGGDASALEAEEYLATAARFGHPKAKERVREIVRTEGRAPGAPR